MAAKGQWRHVLQSLSLLLCLRAHLDMKANQTAFSAIACFRHKSKRDLHLSYVLSE